MSPEVMTSAEALDQPEPSQRIVGPSQECIEKLMSFKSTTRSRKLLEAEKQVIVEFCRSSNMPLIPKRVVNVGPLPVQVGRSVYGNTFIYDGVEVTYAGNLQTFQRCLFRALDMMLSAGGRGFHHLVGICIQHMCLLTSVEPIPYYPPSARKRGRKPKWEKEAKKMKMAPEVELVSGHGAEPPSSQMTRMFNEKFPLPKNPIPILGLTKKDMMDPMPDMLDAVMEGPGTSQGPSEQGSLEAMPQLLDDRRPSPKDPSTSQASQSEQGKSEAMEELLDALFEIVCTSEGKVDQDKLEATLQQVDVLLEGPGTSRGQSERGDLEAKQQQQLDAPFGGPSAS